MRGLALILPALLGACGGGHQELAPSEAQARSDSWWSWHDRKREVDRVVGEAVNEPGGGDYAKAVAAIRASDRPADVKSYEIGMLVISGFESPGAKRSPETLEQGLRMIEDATAMRGEMRRNGTREVQLLFECGAGAGANAIPPTPAVAACWGQINRDRAADPARCISLRRRLLPRVGT